MSTHPRSGRSGFCVGLWGSRGLRDAVVPLAGRRCRSVSGHRRKAVVKIYGGDVLMLHGELSAGGGVEAKEREGRAFSWEEPVVGLENNERKAVDARTVALKERLFAAFDIDFEDKGNVLSIGLGSE
jgi:hypothetical protein